MLILQANATRFVLLGKPGAYTGLTIVITIALESSIKECGQMDKTAESHGFKVEIKQPPHPGSFSLCKDRGYFLRELISNASDARRAAI